MDEILLNLIDRYGEPTLLAMAGGGLGLLFGAAAQRSKFCMRAAAVELAERTAGPRLGIWLVVFALAVAVTQGAIALGVVDLSGARQIAAVGSVSGALIGGALFGIGMILARGCASRLLILAASGNLRAIVTGLVLTLVAQSALRGALSPLRESIARIWTVEGGAERSLAALFGIPPMAWAVLAGLSAVAILGYIWHKRLLSLSVTLGAAVVGLCVAFGWISTGLIAQASFEIVPLSSITFTGPSSDTLMALVNAPGLPLSFATGLVAGVALGAFLMAVLTREFKIERFGPDAPMERYLVGAVLMGFGSMLAGGCAVGAAVSGGALLSITALLAGVAMWAGAMVTHIATTRVVLRAVSPG